MVTSMYSRKETPWHGIGVIDASGKATVSEVLDMSGAGFNVVSKPVVVEGKEVPGFRANVREDNGDVFGIVTGRYKILQNKEAFNFVDALLDMGAKIETAGCLDGGKISWVLAKVDEDFNLLNDTYQNFLFFVNSFDGKNAIKVGRTDVRIVCENTLNLALRNSGRLWSIKHMGLDLSSKMIEASQILEINNSFTKALTAEAEILAIEKVDTSTYNTFLDNLFPISDEDSECIKERRKNDREIFELAYNQDDLANFKGTKWGILQAVSDIAYHTTPKRKTETYSDTKIKYAIEGHPLLDKAYQILQAI